ncbi:MAG: DUF6456 domain-containing protein [Paracoccaceae bacterium]
MTRAPCAALTPVPAAGRTPRPRWLPVAVRHYLSHVEDGQGIRALARDADVHPSTVMRQVRRIEELRDDPLVAAALQALEAGEAMGDDHPEDRPEPGEALRALAVPGAILASAPGIDGAVVARDGGAPVSVAGEVARICALMGWIECLHQASKVARYRITPAGRTALRRILARRETRALSRPAPEVARRGARADPYAATPLEALARRRDRDGLRFLSADQVTAGQRLAEVFATEGHVPGRMAQEEVAGLLTPPYGATPLGAALDVLGPGLADAALRCCCLMEGMEQIEDRMDWSARSGKIVLRLALSRLVEHWAQAPPIYVAASGPGPGVGPGSRPRTGPARVA